MNFYPLNVTPVSGWETHLAGGEAPLQLEAEGRTRLVMHSAGQADMAVVADAEALIAQGGAGAADMSMQAAGSCYLMMFGRAAVACMSIEADGLEEVIPWLGGTATLRLIARGEGAVAQRLTGDGVMRMSAAMSWHNPIAVRAHGYAQVVMDAQHGFPQPHVIRGNAGDAHRSRALVVPKEARAMRVPRDNRLPKGKGA